MITTATASFLTGINATLQNPDLGYPVPLPFLALSSSPPKYDDKPRGDENKAYAFRDSIDYSRRPISTSTSTISSSQSAPLDKLIPKPLTELPLFFPHTRDRSTHRHNSHKHTKSNPDSVPSRFKPSESEQISQTHLQNVACLHKSHVDRRRAEFPRFNHLVYCRDCVCWGEGGLMRGIMVVVLSPIRLTREEKQRGGSLWKR